MESHLLSAFRSGEPEALAQVYLRYAPQVERYVARLARRAHEDVADIVQEVFIRAFSQRVRERYDGQRAYAVLLLVIARSIFLDRVKRHRREILTAPEAMELVSSASVEASEPEAPVDAVLLEATLDHIRELPPSMHSVYEKRFVEALTQHQAAAALGISRQTLRTREQKLLAGLRLRIGHTTAALEARARLQSAGRARRSPQKEGCRDA